jgi:hypothetical protein
MPSARLRRGQTTSIETLIEAAEQTPAGSRNLNWAEY